MLVAQLHARTKLFAGGAHLAAQIISVAKPAQRQGLAFARPNLPRKVKRLFVLLAAFVDPSEREVGVAPQMVNASSLQQEAGLDRCGFGVLEDFQCSLLTVSNAQAFCDAD